MLVMRRRAGEGFLIGPDIEIEILEVSPTRVKIGIKAPGTVAIVRQEVVLTRQQNVTASQTASASAIAWLSENLAASQKTTSRSRQEFDATNIQTILENLAEKH
jgi:carbon storage regulator